jgi:SAM-dependent methyltransferase
MLQGKLSRGIGVDVSIAPECDEIPRLEFVRTSIESALPDLPSRAFDLILLISVLEHLDSPSTVLSHCRRILKPDGSLMVNVPTWLAKPVLELSAFKWGMSPAYEMDDHKMYYSKRDLWPLLVKAGFKPSRIRLKYHRLGMILFGVARTPQENDRL